MDVDLDDHDLLMHLAETVPMLVITLCQATILIVSMFQFKHNESADTMDKSIRHWYFAVVLMGLFTLTLVDFYGISGILGLSERIPSNSTYCSVAVIACNISIITYFACVFMFYLYRIYCTFKGSHFALTFRTFWSIKMLTIVIYLLCVTCIIMSHLQLFPWRPDPAESWLFHAGIIDESHVHKAQNKKNAFCKGNWTLPESITIKIAFECLIIIVNIFYGFFFYDTLSRFLYFTNNCSGMKYGRQFQLKKLFILIHKQNTLVVVSTTSTLILWSLSNVLYFFMDRFVQIWIYLDILFNCVCLWLMFNWNDQYYDRYCVLCRYCNDKSIFQFSYNETLREVKKYPDDPTDPALLERERRATRQRLLMEQNRKKRKRRNRQRYDSDGYAMMDGVVEEEQQLSPAPLAHPAEQRRPQTVEPQVESTVSNTNQNANITSSNLATYGSITAPRAQSDSLELSQRGLIRNAFV